MHHFTFIMGDMENPLHLQWLVMQVVYCSAQNGFSRLYQWDSLPVALEFPILGFYDIKSTPL